MRVNTFEDNIKFELENKEVALMAILENYPDLEKIEHITDRELQLLGVDYIVHFKDGSSKNIDVKIRRGKAMTWNTPADQDFLLEYKQGQGPGWASDSKLITDDVLFIWPDFIGTDYLWNWKISHEACKTIVKLKRELVDEGTAKMGCAGNGITIALFLLVKISAYQQLALMNRLN
jgi:hypothetical protein